MVLEQQCAALEAVLFSAGEPSDPARLAEALETDEATVAQLAEQLEAYYQETGSALQVLSLGGSYQLTTRAEHGEVIRRALEIKRNTPLSNAAMEALTIIAYNQPVTKGFVERVRGVDSGSVVNTLVERGLLEEAGRIEVPGRPVTYRTTAQFLRCFGMSSLEDLPPLPTDTEPDLFAADGEDAESPETELSESADRPEEENIETVEDAYPTEETAEEPPEDTE